MAKHNFGTVVDDMVQTTMVHVNGITRQVTLNVPSAEEIGLWIVESSADKDDYQLLEWFAMMREQYVLGPIPEPCPRGREFPDLPDAAGEIDYQVPCSECGHDALYHGDNDGWLECYHGYSPEIGMPCNCGNNTGR